MVHLLLSMSEPEFRKLVAVIMIFLLAAWIFTPSWGKR
jgi:hypothetical protein